MASTETPGLAPLVMQQGGGLLASTDGSGSRGMPNRSLGKASPLAALNASEVATLGDAVTGKLAREVSKQGVRLGSASKALPEQARIQAMLPIARGKSGGGGGGKSSPRKLQSMAPLVSNEPLTIRADIASDTTQPATSEAEISTPAAALRSPRVTKARHKSSRKSYEAGEITVETMGTPVGIPDDQIRVPNDQSADRSNADGSVAVTEDDAGALQKIETETTPDTTTTTNDQTPDAPAPGDESDNDSDAFDFEDIGSQEGEDCPPVEAAPVEGVSAESSPDDGPSFNGMHSTETEREDPEKSTLAPDDTQKRRETIDPEKLYGCPASPKEEQTSSQRTCGERLPPKMSLPRASDIELFHVVLTQDTNRLQQMLQGLSPEEILSFVDSTGRCIFHYAALSRNARVRDMVFGHVNSYQDQQLEMEIQQLMRSKINLHAWVEGSRSSQRGWIPPRVKELQRESTEQKCNDWKSICSSLDENGRSFFHYIATTSLQIPVNDDYECCSSLRSNPNLLTARDICEKMALHYAVEADNIHQVKWFFRMGVRLKQRDVDLLLSINTSRVMESVLLQQLESIDTRSHYSPAFLHNPHDETNDPDCDPGVSSFVLAKLQRSVNESAGRLHQSPLHRAAMYGNTSAVELLLERGADPNARDVNGWTALHYCADEATSTHLAIAELLFEAATSIDINARSVKGRTPLHIVVRSNKHQAFGWDSLLQQPQHTEGNDRIAFVTLLHSWKADLNAKDACGATPLLLACRGDHIGVVRFLLNAGCDETVVGENGWNALHLAAIQGNPAMVSLLVSWDADSRVWRTSADQHGRKPADVAKNDETRRALRSIWSACYSGNVDQAKYLLLRSEKKDPRRGRSRGSLAAVQKTPQTERTALHFVVQGYFDLVQTPPPTLQGPISSYQEKLKRERLAESRRTASSRFSQLAVVLLQAGADACAGDKWGVTPLMLAASVEDASFINIFLERIAEGDLLTADIEGNTALHYSYAFCQAKISTILEDEMDDPEITNQQGSTPLEMTAFRSKIFPDGFRQHLNRHQALPPTLNSGKSAKRAV